MSPRGEAVASRESVALDLLANIARVGRAVQQAAERGETSELSALIEERQQYLRELHELVGRGLSINAGAVGKQWGLVMEQDAATEQAMADALERLRASLKSVRMKRRTTNTYGGANRAPRPALYYDMHG